MLGIQPIIWDSADWLYLKLYDLYLIYLPKVVLKQAYKYT